MGKLLNNLNNEYKQLIKEANSKEEKQKIKQAYKEMKQKTKKIEKMIKNDHLPKSSDKFWAKLERTNIENPKVDKLKIKNDKELNEINEKIEVNERQFEEQKKRYEKNMQKIDELMKKIDDKMQELEENQTKDKDAD